MKHINLNRMLQGCSAFIQMMAGDRAARNGAKRVNNHVLPLTCPLLASSLRLTCPLQLRRIALILCVLAMSVGQMWGEVYKTYSLSDLTNTSLTYEKTGLSDNDQKLNKGERKVEVPCASASGTLYLSGTGAKADRYASIWGSNGTAVDATRKIAMTEGYGSGISFTSADILTEGGKYYIIFSNVDGADYKINAFKYTLSAACGGGGCTAPSSVSVDATNTNGWRYSLGETIDLTCTAEGGTGTKTYQWQKYIGSTWTDINTATNASAGTARLQIANCTSSDGGSYRCVVSTGATCSLESDGYYIRVFTLNGAYYGGSDTENAIVWTDANTGVATVHLNASSTYMFKVTDNDGRWFGNGENNYIIQPVALDCGTDNQKLRLLTGPEGDYTFTINVQHAADVSPYVNIATGYPTVSHPNSGYAYITKWWDCYIHYWEGTNNDLTAWGSDPKINSDRYVNICGTDYWYFPVIDTYNKFIAKNNAGNETDNNTTGNQETTGHGGKYITHDGSSWGWHEFTTYTISFANGGGTGTMSAMANLCPGDDPVLPANTFTRTGYTFNGWKTNVAITANSATVAADGAVAAGATINDIATDITLTAQWTPKEYTITLGRGSAPSGDGGEDGSAKVLYNGTGLTNISHAVYPGHVLTGYYDSNKGGNKIFNADGSFAGSTVKDLIADGKWVKAENTSVKAQWACIDFTPGRGGTADGTYTVGEDGGTLTCSVAEAGSYTYQWKQYTSGQDAGDAVNAVGTGATSTSFTPHPTVAGTYYYFCEVTNSCDVKKTTSTSGTFVFNAAAYTVTYNKNGDGAGGAGSVTGTVPSDATSYTSGQRPVVKGPGDLAWDGHTFIGWNDKADGSGTYYSEKANFAISASKILYAQWRTASSCPGSAGGTVFSLSMNNNTSSAIAFNYGESKLLSSYATIQRGDASFTDIRTSNDPSGTKATITKASPAKLKIEGNDVTIMLFLDCALQQGDVLTFTETNNRQLYITTTPSRATTIATTSNSYTIPAESPLIGKRVIYLWRNSSTYNIDAITITRPASVSNYTDLSVTKDPSAGSASAPTISATSVAVGSGVTVTAGAAASGYVFTGWTSENGTFADANSLSTTFTPNADNAVATANYAVLKTITIKFQHNGNTTGWTIQGKTTYPADQTATINVDGDWVVMTFSNVYAVSNIDLAYSGGDWDYLKTSTKITDDACYNWTGTAISCAELTAIEANTLYQAQDMANVTFTGDDQWFAGLSTNSKFKVYGNGTSTSAFGKNENHSVTDDIDTKNFTSALYITTANNTSSTDDPTQGAIEFITPSTAGTLYLYLNTDKSGLSIKEKGASSSTSLSGAAYKKIDVEANTHYFINGAGDKRGLYGIKFIPAATYTVTYNGSSAGGGTVPVDASSPYTSGSTVTVLGNTGSLTRSIEGDAATFYGWNTNSNMYGGTHYNAGETFSMPSSDVTLYAVWGYTITWDLNDGDWVGYAAPTYYIYGQGLTLPAAAKISKSGYTFDHWELAYDNSTITAIADDATGNVTLNAIWTAAASSYSVTYNGNDNTGGSVPTDATSYNAGDIVTVKGNTGSLVKSGQTFLGWNTADDYTGTFYPADYKFAMPAGAVTLYAVWGTGQVCYTITDFETNNYNQSSNSNKPDGLSKYLYGYQTTIDTDHALTLSSDNSNTKGQNKGVELRLDNRATLRIYANNVTNAAPAEFENITQISFKAKLYNSSGSERTTPYTIKVGGTTVGSGNIVGQSTDGYFDITTGTLATPKNGYVAITLGGSGSNQNLYIDDIEICTGSGSSGHTVTFDNNGEGTYSKTITNVPSGSKIGVPIPAPTADGNTFGGWYKENTCTNEWNFASDVVNSDKTLYAKWTNCLPTITTQPVGHTYTRGGAPVAMTVETSGDVTGYQWFSNDENNATTGTPIDGQTTGGYTPTTGVVGTTYYYCVVSNDCGSVASNVVAIVVNDDRLTPCAAWTIAEPTHGGQGFSFSVAAKKSDCSEAWDGTLTEGMLTVSEGVILGAITVNNGTKTISGTYGVSGTAESPVTFYLSLPRTDTHSAALLSQTRDFTACEGGAEEFYWSANVSSPLTANTAAKLVSKTTDTEIELSGSTSANSSTRTTDTATGIVDGTTYSFLNSDPHHTYIKMGSGNTFHFTTTATATISIQFSTPSNDNSGIEIRQSSSSGTVVASKMITSKAGQFQTLTASSVAAGTYYVVAVNKEMNIGEILVVQGSGSAGDITPTLAWSNSDAIVGTVEKNEDAADFAVTANRNDANARASLGTISYSSSNTSVATVNAATGQVTIADNIDFGSADYKTTTITATLAASGCYERAQISYVLQVNKYVCTDAPGTVTIKANHGCEGIELTVTDFETGATGFQWYKNGDIITGATNQDYTANVSGTYSVVTHKNCDVTSSNSVKVTIETATATKIVDEWYVKKDRRTPDIALVQTTNATGFTVTVKSSSTVIWNSDGTVKTGFAGCGFYLGTDGIIYLKGEKDNGDEPAKDDGSWAAGDVTLSITATACANASPVEITIHKQASTDNPSIAFVVDGGVGKAVNNVSPDKTSKRALWTYLTSAFDLTGCNIYWTTDEKALRQYYSQYDAILITDDPNTRQYPDGKDEKISATKGYVNAMGTLIDVRPMLTMEAYVSRLANWDCVKGTPYSPSPRDYVLKLQCKEHAIYKDLEENGTTVRHEEIDGIDHWYVTMVDASNKTYADTDDETDATGTPALQGFDGKVNAGMLGIGTIANETLQGGIERQAEPAARMMVLGINNKAMAALTDPGKKVIMNALTYLLHTDMETLEDCSNYFHGQGGTSTDWFTAANWSAGKVPDPTVRAVILAPCEIAGATPARASSVDIAVGGRTGRYKSGASDCEGHLTIAATGALVVSEGVRRIEDAPNFGVDSRKPTQTSDLYIASTSDNGNGTLIFDNPDGNTQATVGYYSKATTNEAETWNWQYMAVPFNDNSSAYRNFYDSYLYRWAENCSGWEVVPNRGAVYPWVGYTITQVGAKTYYMDGTLVETGEQTFTVPAGKDLVLGNSWTAPLQVKQFEDDDFDGLVKNVYLFNTGYDYDKNGTQYVDGATHYEAGTYVVVPIHSSPYTGDSLISSLQAFTVTSEDGEGTLTLDYERHVRPARSTDKVNAGPMHAPRRAAAREDKPTVLKIWASGQRFDDRLVVLEREDFSTGLDRGWDGEKVLMGEMSPTVYSVMENGYESVTATNDYEGTLIGFKAGEDNEYTFRFEYDDDAEPLFLLDMDERMYVRILTGTTYTFTCADKGEHNRFLLTRKAPGIPTGCEPIDGGGGPKAMKFIKDNKLYILLNGVLYDATGKVVE